MPPDGVFRIVGADQLRAVGRDLAAAGDAGKLLRKRMRRNIVAAVQPMRRDVQDAYRALPSRGADTHALRVALAKATKIRITTVGPNTRVQLRNGHQLAPLVEGARPWRHPIYPGKRPRAEWHWASQEAHPTFYPTIEKRIPAVQAAALAAVAETAAEIDHR